MTYKTDVAEVAVLLGLLYGCYERPPVRYRAFFELPVSRQADSITAMPARQQVEVYLWGVTKMGPPQLHLTYPVAKGGQPVLVAALDTLRLAETPLVKERILHLLAWMQCYGQDLSRDSATMSAIGREVAGVDFGPFAPLAQESMELIQGQRDCAVDHDEIRRRLGGRKDS